MFKTVSAFLLKASCTLYLFAADSGADFGKGWVSGEEKIMSECVCVYRNVPSDDIVQGACSFIGFVAPMMRLALFGRPRVWYESVLSTNCVLKAKYWLSSRLLLFSHRALVGLSGMCYCGEKEKCLKVRPWKTILQSCTWKSRVTSDGHPFRVTQLGGTNDSPMIQE